MRDCRCTTFLLVSLLVFLAFIVAIPVGAEDETVSLPPPTRIRTPHAPISITSDSDFATQAASESWPGTGIETDPYIISTLEINGSGYLHGITISNTRAHFVISDCLVIDTNDLHSFPSGYGIFFESLKNGTIKDCQILRSYRYGIYVWGSKDIHIKDTLVADGPRSWGVYVDYCRNFMIEGCDVQYNEQGIRFEETTTGSLRNCTISDHSYNGIELYDSSGLKFDDNLIEDNGVMGIYLRSYSYDNEFHRNSFSNCSFAMFGDEKVFTRNHIPVDNTVNGLPVHQYKDHVGTGEGITSGGGQLILGNVTNVVISGLNISKASEALILGHCSLITVRDCNLSGNVRGLEAVRCDNITVEHCSFLDCIFIGVYLEEAADGIVRENRFCRSEMGIAAYDDILRFIALNNTVSNCDHGISVSGAREVVVRNNLITGSDTHALILQVIWDGRITGNHIDGQGSTSFGMGIYGYMVEDTVIDDNLIFNTKNGMSLYVTKRSLIKNNTFDSSLDDGILLIDSDNCTFTENLFYRSTGAAICVQEDYAPTADNLFWQNSFLYNNGTSGEYTSGKYQAHDGTGLNHWYSSAEGKGNHWSDLMAPDADNDGIVDVPYPLSGGAMDQKPLVQQPLLLATPPTYVSAQAGRETVNISWGPPLFTRSGQISGYRIFRSQNGSEPSLLLELSAGAEYYVDDGVETDTSYNYSVMALNRYGDGMMSEYVEAIPDSTPPQINITTPADVSFWNVTTLEASWESSDNVGVAGHRVRLDSGNWTEVGIATSMLISNLTEGEHFLDVEAYDAVNNSARATSQFHIDLTPPEVRIVHPNNGSIISTSSFKARWQPRLQCEHRWRIDGGEWNILYGDNWANLENLIEGSHLLEIQVIDWAGNIGRNSTSFIIDPIAPIIEITEPMEGEEFKGRPINASWTADGTGSSIVRFGVKLDSGLWEDVGLATSTVLMSLEKGDHIFWVTAEDEAGNTNTASVNFSVTSDIPDTPTPGKGLVIGTVNDKGGAPVPNVKVTADTGEETKTDSNGMFSLELPAGNRTLTFSRDGYKTGEITISVEENGTFEMDPIVMEKNPADKPWSVWYYCICCLASLIVIVVLLMIIGLVSRLLKRSKRKHDEE
ncbi:MAG: right-handed parallel beta-helix repeat-containing protein [Candidatus Thermoplasmatota archaeon]|nr:right-handed parallel beta-helix repeat-containing protein [Candidatus Thermoplasmatota archaeon]